jgi:hypothetical protein
VPDLAELAPEVEASIAPDVGAVATTASIREALEAAAATLRSESVAGGASATVLRDLADRLAGPHAWVEIDRLVHELVTDLLLDALAGPDDARADALAARAFALRTIARDPSLWPGAGTRRGTSQSYDGLLAAVRMRATAAATAA